MNVNEQVWGEEFWEVGTGTINCRSNVTEKTDTDYEDFPPFISNKVPGVADTDYHCSLFQFVENNKLQLNEEIDKSICYVGFEGGALSDISAWHSDEWHTGEPWLYTTPDDNNTTYMLVDSYMDKSIATPSMGTSTGTVWPSNYTTAQLGLFNRYINWSPDAITGGDLSTTANQKLINRNLRLSPYRSWGLRSIYLVINVAYLTNSPTDGGSTNPTFSKTTLHSYYADHTDTWRNTHPILGAWAIPYSRISKAGGYSNTQTSGTAYNRGNHTTSVSIISELHDGDGIRYDYRFATNYNVTMGYFPLFGYVGLGHPDVTSIPASSDTLASPLYMGMRTAPNIVKKASTNKVLWAELDGNAEGTYDYLMSCCAFYGLYFADGTYSLASIGQDETRWTDPNMCLPIISDEGYTNGGYTRGAYNVTNSAFEWKDTTQSPYTPGTPPGGDPTQYSDETGFNVLGGVANCNKVYAVNASNIMNLAKALSTAITTRLSDLPPLDYSIETFLTNNPLDCVVSLRKYPVTNLSSGTEEPISFGSYQNANVQGIPFVKSYDLITFTFSNAARNSLYPHFGDFRDYEPYTHAELIVPFCGTVQINPCDFIGHDINVYMVIDYITGGCTAYAAADRIVLTSIAGTIGVDVPLSGIQTATLESQRVNAVMSRKSADIGVNNAIVGGLSSSVGLLASAGAGNVLGAVGSGAGLVSSVGRIEQSDIAYQKADYELKHQQVPFKQVSAGTPIASTVIENCCRLIIYRPVLDVRYNAEVYAKTVGFACLMNGKVSDFTGFTVGNINVDGLAITDTEKQAIQKAFANGVIL